VAEKVATDHHIGHVSQIVPEVHGHGQPYKTRNMTTLHYDGFGQFIKKRI